MANKMQVKVTKTMAKMLKENITLDCIEDIYYTECDQRTYRFYVDSLWDNDTDLNEKNGKMKLITVTYKPQCYAIPYYLTTRELLKAFRRSDKTLQGFIDEITDVIGI